FVLELLEANNAKTGDAIGIGSGPDYVFSAVSGPSSSLPGSSLSASVTVCNQGTAPGWGTNVQVLLSTDTSITLADTAFAMAPVPNLNPGQCTTVTAMGYPWVADGAYVLGAIVDPWESAPELLEANNATAGNAIGIGFEPDLIVSAVS